MHFLFRRKLNQSIFLLNLIYFLLVLPPLLPAANVYNKYVLKINKKRITFVKIYNNVEKVFP